MGKVIKYTNKAKQGGTVSPSGKSTSAPLAKAPKTKRMGNIKDPVRTWCEADLDLHRQLLLKLMKEAAFSEAMIVAKHLNDLAPMDAYAWYLRGTALLELSDPVQAETCLLKSMELEGTDGPDCMQMSRARLLQGDLEGAVDWCRRALELKPDEPVVHWLLMNIHFLRGELNSAIAVGNGALPKMVETSDEARTRLKLANLYLSASSYQEAEEQLQKAMKLEHNNAQLWSMLGHCLSRQHKIKESLKAFQRAAEIDPGDPNTLFSIADAFLGLDHPDKAVNPLLRAVQLKHDFSLAHYGLSLAYLKMKKYRESEMAARAALCDDPEMSFQRSSLGMGATENLGLGLLNLGRMEEAEDCFRRNLQLFAKTYFNLGLTLFRTQRYEEALENFRRALELEPKDSEYHNLLGQTYYELEQPVEAEQSLHRAIEIDRNYALGYYDLGVILAKLEGRNQEALAAFEQALKIDPDIAQAYYAIACLHALSQKKGPALAFLEKALQKGFRDIEYMEKDSDWDGFRTNPKFIRLLAKYRDTGKAGRMSSIT